jgi:type II secretory pathway pseudopilin PulG
MRRLSNERGFTVVEVVTLVLLLGIIALVVMPHYFGAQIDANKAVRTSTVTTINSALALYQTRNGSCPPSGPDTSISAFLRDATYFPSGVPVDPYTGDDSTFVANYSATTCRTK